MSHSFKVDYTFTAATDVNYTDMLFGPYAEVFQDTNNTACIAHPEYDLSASVADEAVNLGTVATPAFLYLRNNDATNSVSFKLSGNATAHTLTAGSAVIFAATFTSLTLTNANAAAVKLAIFVSGAA